MDINSNIKEFLQNYNQLIEQLGYLFTDDDYKEYLIALNNETKDKKWENGNNFNKLLTDEYFQLFVDSKVKLFSSEPLAEALFGEKLSLKKIFHNRDDSIKFVLWSYLHLMVLMIESSQPKKNKDRIKKLIKVIGDNLPELEKSKNKAEKLNKSGMSDPKNIIKDLLGVNVNSQTNEMIEDIMKSFETSLSGGDNANPFAGILDISKKISTKYSDKINTGEIQLDKLMEGIQKSVPGMDKMLGGGGLGAMGGMSEMMGGLFNGKKEEKKETVIIDENFSTSQVDLGQIKESKGMNIGKMLNVADSLGVIPGGDNSGLAGLMSSGLMSGSLLSGMMPKGDNKTNTPNMPNMSELFNMMGGLDKMKSKEEAAELKGKLDSFLEKNLGLDVNKLNQDIKKMVESKTNSKGNADDSKEKVDEMD
jgi:hypothetical protein